VVKITIYKLEYSYELKQVYVLVVRSIPLWSRILLEELLVLQLVKKFPVFYKARKFITTFTAARHMSIS